MCYLFVVLRVREMHNPLSDVLVGHAHDEKALTGCSVIILPEASPYQVFVTGGAFSFRQVSALVRYHSLHMADAFLLTGGSAYGLDAGGGVMAFLKENGRGIRVGSMVVPSVPTSAIFDLFVGESDRFPDKAMGYEACVQAKGDRILCGRVGVGIGATVGKALGIERASWGGFGFSSEGTSSGAIVCAFVVVNAFGNVIDFETGKIIAGVKKGEGEFLDAEEILLAHADPAKSHGENTTIAVIVTDASLEEWELGRVSIMASQAFPLTIRPTQTMVDGDAVFCATLNRKRCSVNEIAITARNALMKAIRCAVLEG